MKRIFPAQEFRIGPLTPSLLQTLGLCPALLVCLLALSSARAQSSGDQTFTGNIEISAGLSVQQDTDLRGPVFFGMLPQNPNLEAFHIDVTQGYLNGMQTVLVPAHTAPLTMVVESYAPARTAKAVPVQDYGWIDQPVRIHRATLDITNAVTVPRWTEQVPPIWGPLSTSHEVRRTGSQFEISGTRAVTFPADQPAHYETIRVRNYTAPVIQFTATRSDAVWAWRTPDPSGGVDYNGRAALKDIMTLSDGNLTLNGDSGLGSLSITPASIGATHVLHIDDGGGYSANTMTTGADGLDFLHQDENDSVMVAASHAQVVPNAIILTREEDGQPTGITQIAAKSAQFGGVVTVEGNANVKGVLRVNPAGDLDMGTYKHGTKPDGTPGTP